MTVKTKGLWTELRKYRFSRIAAIAGVIVSGIVMFPAAAVTGIGVFAVQHKRPDRLVGIVWALAFAPLAVYIGAVVGTSYFKAWIETVSWVFGGESAWSSLGHILFVGAVFGPVVGIAYWSFDQWYRERQPVSKHVARELRRDVEAARKRWITQQVQALAHAKVLRLGERDIEMPDAVSKLAKKVSMPLGTPDDVILGTFIDGDIRWPRHWGYLTMPKRIPHRVILGASRCGKSELGFRLAEFAMEKAARPIQAGEKAFGQVIYLDCKQKAPGKETSLRLAAHAQALGLQANVLVRDHHPYDPMRGDSTEVRNRLVGIQEWSEPWYRDGFVVLVGIALDLAERSGKSIESLPELLYTLDKDRLKKLAGKDPQVEQFLSRYLNDRDFANPVMRTASNALSLRGWIGPQRAGGWSFEDADLSVAELPTSTEPDAARMLLRLMLTDLELYLCDYKRRPVVVTKDGPQVQPIELIIEEYSALDGDPILGRRINNLMERAAGAGVKVTLVAHSPESLGDTRTQSALLTNSAVCAFRQSENKEVDRLIALAGTEAREEASVAYTDAFALDRGTGSIRMQESFKVSPNLLRSLPQGECIVFDQNKWARVAVGMTEWAYKERYGMHELEELLEQSRRPRLHPGLQPRNLQIESGEPKRDKI